jgi:hypothetical protein
VLETHNDGKDDRQHVLGAIEGQLPCALIFTPRVPGRLRTDKKSGIDRVVKRNVTRYMDQPISATFPRTEAAVDTPTTYVSFSR